MKTTIAAKVATGVLLGTGVLVLGALMAGFAVAVLVPVAVALVGDRRGGGA